ncbi:MAG: hypothetical protein LBH15_02005, partial [Treponema sp.]|nr:hypothetical protein [Treponema sp.]
MHRLVFALLASVLLCAGGFAQPGPPAFSGGEPPRPDFPDSPGGASVRRPDLPAGPFPLLPVLETALVGEVLWRPDWPVEIPPDIFAVSGQARSVTVALEFPGAGGREGSAGADTAAPPDAAVSSDRAGPPDAAGRAEFALAYDEAGRLTDFPFFENGGFFQTRADYDDLGRISGLAVSAPGSRQFEFLEYDRETGRPSLLRINAGSAAENAGGADSGGSWFFVVLEYRGLSASETWYDSAGAGLAFYSYRYALQAGKKRLAESAGFSGGESRAAEYYYDSWGNLTGIGGAYSAVYRGSRPQYWRRPLDPALPG